MKFSGGYVAINPNFVMSEMQTIRKIDFELEGVIAVLQNILLRGAPTKPSVFLKDNIGEVPKTKGYCYTVPTKPLYWEKTIKGGSTNPAVSFYEKFTHENPEAFCFLPECRLNEIIYDEKIKDSFAVDFYSPFHRMVVEIDGAQHSESVQKISDKQRNQIVRDKGLKIVRISSKECADEKFLESKIKEIMQNQTTLRFLSEEKLSIEQKAYMYVFRFQMLLLEMLAKGYWTLENGNMKINIQTSADKDLAEKSFEFAYDDLKIWIENLYFLLNKKVEFPHIEIDKNAEICVDLDIYNRYDDNFFCEENIVKIRNDYFPYDKDSLSVTESKVIDEKLLVSKYCQFKNYYSVKTSDLRFNDVSEKNETHKQALTFFLKNIFNHNEFRPKQLEIVANGLNDKKGVIGLLPTGSGKSVCYQLVSFLTPTITLVITPLKLLMNDQKENLFRRNLIMTSYQIHAEEKGNKNVFANRQAKLLYISPERFFSEDFANLVKMIPIGQIVIDEVHCLSEWGHDFRTSYLLLFSFLQNSYLTENVLLMGTSATASPRVIHDIKQEFKKIKDEVVEIKATSINRPELCFNVEFVNDKNKTEKLLELVEKGYAKGDKILIFCSYRATTLDLQKALNERNPKYNAHRYYSGFLNDEKYSCDDSDKQKETAFVEFANGKSKVLAATKAFGMGIDIQDIRQTIHFDIASSVESIYQEMGRAGRDGKKSCCTVLYLDRKQAKENIENLFDEELSIEKLKKQQESDKYLSKYGVVSKQLCLLIRDNKDYKEWSDFIYSVYLFLTQEERKEDFELWDLRTYLKERNPNISFDGLQIEFEKALYKLYTLGVIDLWSVSYANGQMNNPIYSKINVHEFSKDVQLPKLENHISRFGRKYIYDSDKNGDSLNAYITALCKWDNENFLNYRWKSLHTLYKMVSDFNSSELFASRIEKFFLDSDKLESVIINKSEYKDWMEILFETEADTLLYQLERYSLDYFNNPAIEFLQGMIAIKSDNFKKEPKQKFKKVLSEIFSKVGNDNATFVSDCLSYFDDDIEAQKRYLVFLADNFPAIIKHKEAKKYLKSFDETIANELLDRPTYNSIYATLEKLKLTLGDKK